MCQSTVFNFKIRFRERILHAKVSVDPYKCIRCKELFVIRRFVIQKVIYMENDGRKIGTERFSFVIWRFVIWRANCLKIMASLKKFVEKNPLCLLKVFFSNLNDRDIFLKKQNHNIMHYLFSWSSRKLLSLSNN